jgi:predicted nucleic acid-binding protein
VVRDRLRQLVSTAGAAVNDVVRLEVLLGYRTREAFDRMNEELGAFEPCEVTARTWDKAATLGYELRRAGLIVPLPDLVIAANAIERGYTLVHIDRGFDHIAERSDLQVESYVAGAQGAI